MRVCGENVAVVAEVRLSNDASEKSPNTRAFYGLAVRRTVSSGRSVPSKLFYFSADGSLVRQELLPKLAPDAGIPLSRSLDEVIVLRTDVNSAVSTSGYTPLLVPLD